MPRLILCSLPLAATLVLSALGSPRLDEYAVILRDSPAAAGAVSRRQLLSPSPDSRVAGIRAAQQSVRARALRNDIRISGASQILLNAVFVRATASQAATLRAMPEVARVVLVPPLRPLMDRAANLVRAPAAWTAAGGVDNAGAGVRIAVIDTGLDDRHPAFQDSALQPPADPPAVPEAYKPYTNSKIIAARSYVDRLAYEDDTSPLDHVGHGTAVAMIAAGVANSGPAAAITGVAPKAWLGNYKIFGSPGLNENSTAAAVIAALEDALMDGMDIAVLAVGSEPLYPPRAQDQACIADGYGLGVPSGSCDPLAEAVERAVAMGLTVVVPAGDDAYLSYLWYPTFGTIFSPGTAPSAITVGASLNSYAALRVSGDAVPAVLRQVDALFGDGPRPGGVLTGTVADVAQLGSDGLLCSPVAAGSLANRIALVQRGTCDFSTKLSNAQAAGAIAVVLFQSDGSDAPLHPLGLSATGIPAAMIGNTAGLALRTFLRANPDRTVALDPALPVPGSVPEQIAGYSSRGPALDHPGAATIKPDVAAPGEAIYSATQALDISGYYYDPSGYTFVEGTSVSAAVVAGVAAMVRQQHPEFTAAQVKSAVVNTAVAEIADGDSLARVNAAGAGKVNAEAAVLAAAVAEPATISFGALAGLPVSVPLRVTNTGKEPAAVGFSVEQRDPDSAAQVTVNPSGLQLAPGKSAVVRVALDGTLPAAGSYEGIVKVQAGASTLRVPYLYIVTDGQPFDIFPIFPSWGEFTGAPGSKWRIVFRVVDQWGLPVANLPVSFTASGGGGIDAADGATDITGKAAADVTLGSRAGNETITAVAGGLQVQFYATVSQ